MGNIGSQTGQITQRPIPEEQQWAHSFPRTQPRLHQHKVLPERDSRQKLRHTNNGEILQSGGTLSGRHHQNRLSLREVFYPYFPNNKITVFFLSRMTLLLTNLQLWINPGRICRTSGTLYINLELDTPKRWSIEISRAHIGKM